MENILDSELITAIKEGNLTVIKELINEINSDNITYYCETAIINNQSRILEYIFPENIEEILDKLANLISLAIYHNNFEITTFLIEKGHYQDYNKDDVDLYPGVNNYSLDILQYCNDYEVGYFSPTLMDTAASLEDSLIFIWFHDNGFECTSAAMNLAAECGNLNIIKFIHKFRNEGCTTDAMNNAVTNGHFKVVKWLYKNRKQDCDILAALELAKRCDSQEIMQYLGTIKIKINTCISLY